jgi:hypothetical protein
MELASAMNRPSGRHNSRDSYEGPARTRRNDHLIHHAHHTIGVTNRFLNRSFVRIAQSTALYGYYSVAGENADFPRACFLAQAQLLQLQLFQDGLLDLTIGFPVH